jgi:hypothetical protein
MTTPSDFGSSHDRIRLADPDITRRAPRRICELCGAAIMASQDARLEPDGRWLHEACQLAPEALYQAG